MADFGRYQLERKLGQGGMAEVFLARQQVAAGVERTVVIKRVRRTLTDDPEFLRLFVEEARLSLQLGHGNLVQVFDFGDHEGQHFLAMEWVDGTTAGGLLRLAKQRGFRALPAPVAASLCIELCRGLHYAHTRADAQGQPLRIVHRDISPENVLISWEGQVKLADFGIARAALAGRAKTSPDIFRGRLEFCAPEQALGRAVDARTDLYAVGVLLSTLVLGRNPVGTAEDALRIATGVAEVPSFPPWVVDDGFAEIVDRCVRRAPDERFESAQALQVALQAWVSTIDTAITVRMLSESLALFAPEELERRGLEARPRDAFIAWASAWQPGERPRAGEPTSAAGGELVSTRDLAAVGAGVGLVLLLVGAVGLGWWLHGPSLEAAPAVPTALPVGALPVESARPPAAPRLAHAGPGEVALGVTDALVLSSVGRASVAAPSRAAWEVMLNGAPAFVSFFSSTDELLSTQPVVHEGVASPPGAVRARAWVPSLPGAPVRGFLWARDVSGTRPGDEVDLGVDTNDQMRFTSLDPSRVWELKVDGQAPVLVRLGPGGVFRPAERLGSMAVLEPGGVLTFSGATFVGVSQVVSERRGSKTSRVSVQAVAGARRR